VATHKNLNDGTLEGFRHASLPILAAQFHPEAAPGPHDANVLFDAFLSAMRASKAT
jgi:carbamoyl-phosphate synthase small subunit